MKDYLDLNKKTPYALALECKITPTTMYRILKGHKVRNKTLRLLAKRLDISLESVVIMNDNQQL